MLISDEEFQFRFLKREQELKSKMLEEYASMEDIVKELRELRNVKKCWNAVCHFVEKGR